MTQAMHNIIKFHPDDDVALALSAVKAGLKPSDLDFTVIEDIPAAHKIACRDISKGELVTKYNQVIGKATKDIKTGQHVHVHNLGMAELSVEYEIGTECGRQNPVSAISDTFEGIVRPDGSIATRNYIGIIATCGCSAGVSRMIAERFKDVRQKYPHVDGVVPIKHGSGCAMSTDVEGFIYLQRTLSGWTRHPNFAGVVVVGAGLRGEQPGLLHGQYVP